MSTRYLVNADTLTIQNGTTHQGKTLDELFSFDVTAIQSFRVEEESCFSISGTSLADEKEVLLKFSHFAGNDYSVEVIDDLIDVVTLSCSLDEEVDGDTLFSQMFEHSPVGLVLVNEDGQLYKANRFIFSCFHLKIEDVRGKGFGDVFLCSQVTNGDALCGTTEGCKHCEFRNGIAAVLTDHITLEHAMLEHSFVMNGRVGVKHFQISASPVRYNDNIYALVSFVDITKQITQQRKLEMLGFTDELTRLNNRRYLTQVLSSYLKRKNFTSLCVGLIDIDNFKHVNDTFGHNKGDDVLRCLADDLVDHVRASDYPGRYGGEEFLVVLPDASPGAAIETVDRVRNAFKTSSQAAIGTPVSFSCGMVYVTADYDRGMKYLIALADAELYKVKHAGKDGTRCVEG